MNTNFGHTGGEDSSDAVSRFEQKLRKNESFFFEWNTYELIIHEYVDRGLYQLALSVCEYAQEQHPYSFEVYFEKAQIYLETDQPAKAIKAIEEGEVYHPQDTELSSTKVAALMQLERFEEAEKVLLFLAQVVSEHKGECYYQLGVCYQGLGNLDKAIEALQLAVDYGVEHDNALFELASCLEVEGRLEESVEHYNKVIDQNPYSAISWYNLGVINDRLKHFDEAISAYEYAIAIDESYSSAYYNMALSYMEKEDYGQAIHYFEETIKIEGENKDEKLHLCLAHSYFQLEKYDEALKHYHIVVLVNSQRHEAWFAMATCLFYKNKWHEASHFYSKAIKLCPTNASYWLGRAKVDDLVGNLISSDEAYQQAISLDASNVEIWLNWSSLYADQKEIQKAREIIDSGIEELPDNARLWYRKTAFQLMLKNYKEVYSCLEYALQLDYEKHVELLEFFEELETQKALMKLIDQFRDDA
ncbi:MAG: tetratricopeptide repeat protein [Cytophagales bacterium]|nr:tetratricopeptide repeat protein [Cytophagales bacterium]